MADKEVLKKFEGIHGIQDHDLKESINIVKVAILLKMYMVNIPIKIQCIFFGEMGKLIQNSEQNKRNSGKIKHRKKNEVVWESGREILWEH